MVWYRIYSIFYYLGWTVLYLFLFSHPISRRRCGVAAHVLPGESGMGCIAHPVLRYRIPSVSVSRFLPAFLHLHYSHLLLLCRLFLFFGLSLVSIFRSIYPGEFRPICRICRRDLGGSVYSWDLFRRWHLLLALFVSSFRPEIMVPK